MSTHHPSFSKSSGLGNVFKSISKSLRTNSKNDPIRTNPTVVGGGEDRKALFKELKYGSVSQRVAAAETLTKSLSRYSISSIPEVWYLVRDLCKSDMQSGARRAALNLMIECIKQIDDSESNRLMFFKDITRYCQISGNKVDRDFDLYLEALNVLTDEGKDIHYFCIYDDEKNFIFFIYTSLVLLGEQFLNDSRKASESSAKSHNTLSNLLGLITFIRNCFKINFSLLTEDVVTNILNKLAILGCETDEESLIINILDVIDSVVIFGDMPIKSVPDILKFSSLHYNVHEELDSLIIDLILNLSSDIRINFIVTTLCSFMLSPEVQQQRQKSEEIVSRDITQSVNSFQLAVSIYLNYVFEKGTGMDWMFGPILTSCKDVFQRNVPYVTTSYLRTIDRFLLKDSYDDNFGLVFTDSFDQLVPFYYFHSNSNSFFSPFKSLRLNSEQDVNYFSSICLSLLHLYEQNELKTSKGKLVNFFLGFYQYIPTEAIKFILNSYDEDKVCSALIPEWKENCNRLLKYFCYENTEMKIKIDCLRVIIHGYEISNTVMELSYQDYDVLEEIFERMVKISDDVLVQYLMKDVFTYVALEGSLKSFRRMGSLLLKAYRGNGERIRSKHDSFRHSILSGSFESKVERIYTQRSVECIGESVVFIFLSAMATDIERACLTYDLIIEIFESALEAQDISLMLILSRCLIRLRVTNENLVYFTNPIDMNGLATTFRRALSDSPLLSNSCKWVYPEALEYIPERFLDKPSAIMIASELDNEELSIDVSRWLNIVLKIVSEFIDWELYTFIWAHFCVQLSNINLFKGNKDLIYKLMNVICDQLCLNLPKSLILPERMTKADLQVAYVRNLSALLGYHDIFSKQDEDHIVNSLIYGLGSWEKTAIPCINILTVCCYEIPLSIKKFLTVILTKLQTTVTNTSASTATIEFLMSLIHLPTLTSNFTADEFKIVFGIAFKYIQHSNDMKRGRVDNETNRVVQQHGVDAKVDQTPSTHSVEKSPVLSQYLLSMSYHVISCWFLKISLSERKHFSSFLLRNILLSSEDPKRLDYETIAYLDFITRFTFSDVPLRIAENIKHDSADRVETSKWILGNSIFTIQTNTYSGASVGVIRRPTGTSIFQIEMNVGPISQKPIVSPSALMLEVFNNLDKEASVKPIPLIDDSLTTRALSMIDRTPTLNFHKIGVLYVERNQSEEVKILKNEVGSRAYYSFLRRIGSLIKLKGCKDYYVGGLDTERDLDGEYALSWADQTTQVIFHTTTMMANNENDQFCDLKKRHIGNNYVNVFFDESTLPFDFNIVKSQFNFMNIVISPHTTALTSMHTDSIPESYKVKVYRRSGVPGVFAACHFKIISEKQLPIFVRNLAIMADRFANVWHSQANGSHISNWAHRVKQISTLKAKTIRNHNDLRAEQQESTANHVSNSASTTKSFLEQLQFADYDITPSNETKYEYLTGSENEMYSLFEFNSYVS